MHVYETTDDISAGDFTISGESALLIDSTSNAVTVTFNGDTSGDADVILKWVKGDHPVIIAFADGASLDGVTDSRQLARGRVIRLYRGSTFTLRNIGDDIAFAEPGHEAHNHPQE